MDALFVWHEAQVGEDDETREEACEAVDGRSDKTVPVGRRKRRDRSFCAGYSKGLVDLGTAGSKMQVGALAALWGCVTVYFF